jgi:1-phosphatidylinositol-4-phosphate 5-kinase
VDIIQSTQSFSGLPQEAPSQNRFDKNCRRLHQVRIGNYTTIHLAIIDYLQEWNLSKRMERQSKVLILGKNGDGLSAIEPKAYARRFKDFMRSYLFRV